MNAFNHPPQIAEDAVHYKLYLPNGKASKAEAEALVTSILSFVETLLPDHIWNRDSFNLKPVEDADNKSEWLLEETLRVGDSIDDEWLVVWLLKQITDMWDVLVSIYDTDGDFLLIEAAEYLPSWIQPSNAENRVWIYHSNLHIVPITHVSSHSRVRRRRELPSAIDSDEEGNNDTDAFINVSEAAKWVRDPSISTTASLEVQNAAWRRINNYPAALRQHIHQTTVYLPVDAARALSQDPSLIQKASETFYTRDAVQLRFLHRMSRFPPNPSVLQTVKLTRTAYSQLMGQKFHRPKVFGHWTESEGTKEFRWRDLGMKISCGFEMLYHESKGTTFTNPTDDKSALDAAGDALCRDSEFKRYVENLQATGYFRDELEGSQLWRQLMGKALDIYIQMHKDDNARRPTFTAAVNAALSKCPPDTFHPVVSDEDPDEWMNVDAADFDNMLEKKMAFATPKPFQEELEPGASQGTERQVSQLQDLAKKVENFVEGKGGLDGAMFDDETGNSEGDDFSDGMPSTDGEESDVEMNEPARQANIDNLVAPLDPSEYGKMPAEFYANSLHVRKSEDDSKGLDTNTATANAGPDEAEFRATRRPLIHRDDFDGIDSDDTTDSEEDRINQVGARADEDADSEEDLPQVVGEIDIDMGEEQEDFLKFSRETLGITDSMWKDIVADREMRGVFVPTMPSTQAEDSLTPETPLDNTPRERKPNPNLDSFEAVMQAMERELSKHKQPPPNATPGPSAKEPSNADDEDDIEAALDSELKASLAQNDDTENGEELGNADIDYNLIKNFLESFKSQGGLSGPVSTLAGRLQPGWRLPRDETGG